MILVVWDCEDSSRPAFPLISDPREKMASSKAGGGRSRNDRRISSSSSSSGRTTPNLNLWRY
ncbi:hypothetical protein Scep_011103 [Stephania cephalantha]|uniref:Uncharacterized protein n=1 Tax=Stephania cephalantha TaxID=152367 RepID=A0AAP0JYS8_9MAGN